MRRRNVRPASWTHVRLGKFVASTAQKVLLTGGAGFIGSHLAEALLRSGSQLAIVDELNDFYSPPRKEENRPRCGVLAASSLSNRTFATSRDYMPSSSVSSQTWSCISRRSSESALQTNHARGLRSGLAGQGDCAQQNMSRRRVRWSPQQMLNSTSGGQFATNIGQGRNEGVTHKNLDAYAIHSIVRG